MEYKYIIGIRTGQEKQDRVKCKLVNSIDEADNFALDVAVAFGFESGYVKDRITKKNIKFYYKQDFQK